MLLTEGQISDHKGAVLLFSRLPRPRNYWLTRATTATGSATLLPVAASPHASRQRPIAGSSTPMTSSFIASVTKIENLFARLKDWRRIATRYDRCAHTFMSAITIAATFCFWL